MFTTQTKKYLPQFAAIGQSALLPLATLLLVIFMILPVPATVLDIGFVANITISLAVLMVALNAAKPLDFSSFPTVLLFATLLRLSLNVASTRVVLVQGHDGSGAAGQIIEAFGNLLIGGDYVVGIFVFAILMIINLVVITKGAGRVSEVTARFTLDAMPGKQMAIDADLNAGLLSPEEAKHRRQNVATEADFYGSMDGASKFVKGDAVAGVLILVINILGGIILGVVSHDMTLGDAAQTYVLLAVGDALVAQVPALLLSIAAAAIVTRVASPLDLSGQIGSQFGSAKAWTPVAAILAIIGVLPGMPHVVILPFAGAAGLYAWTLSKRSGQVESEIDEVRPLEHPSQINLQDISDGAVLSLDIGYALVPLVDDRKGAPLMQPLTGIRRQLSRELGFVVPMVRVRDDMALEPNSYVIRINGAIMGEGQCWPDDLLALDSGDVDEQVVGRNCKDPTFGLDAVWIEPEQRSEAVVSGYTVVDAATVVATHFNNLAARNSSELLGVDEVQALIENLQEIVPQLVENVTPKPLGLFQIMLIGRALLSEAVPLRDFRRLCEAMVESVSQDCGGDTSSLDTIVDGVRKRIGNIIVQSIVPVNVPLPIVTLDTELENLMQQAVAAGQGTSYPIEPALAQKIAESVEDTSRSSFAGAKNFAVVTSPSTRRTLLQIIRTRLPEVPVLSFAEIPADKTIEVVAVIGSQAKSLGGPPANNISEPIYEENLA